jgi:hypothetical protein
MSAQRETMIWTHSIPQPPVPQFLREMLKDYPEIIQDIQDGLNEIERKWGTPFNEIWEELESALSHHRFEASEALKEAEQTGDSQAIFRAKIKFDAVVEARRGPSLDELHDYFQAYKGAFE